MLAELRVENLLLIARSHIEFAPGLNALTGETGAGKSLLVDALSFLLGGRGDPAMVRRGAAQAEVFARFLIRDRELADALAADLGVVFDPAAAAQSRTQTKQRRTSPPAVEFELVVSRTLPLSGRGRAHANGRPVALPALKELGERLLDIHGQNENQSLLRPHTRTEILDRFAGALPERAEARQAFERALEAAQDLAQLRHAAIDRQGREDMLRFQLGELEQARLDELDPAALEGEVRLLRGAEKIREAALAAGEALDGEGGEPQDASAASSLARALKLFAPLGDAGPDAATLRQRIDGLLDEVRDCASAAAELAQKARSDPQRLAELEERRDRLRGLERKHGRDLPGLRALREKLRADLADVEQIDVSTRQREAQLAVAIETLGAASEKLARKRKAAARDLEKRVNRELAGLGLKHARLQIVLQPHEAGGDARATTASAGVAATTTAARNLIPARFAPGGTESAEILFSANPGLEARPLKECASGGEISRLMLALKGVLARESGADRLPVVVFDEVDSGVGGRMGAVLGKKLSELAKVRQVLCVTHQPQIAAYAERQMRVEKTRHGGDTLLDVEVVDGARRVDELALMLRGAEASEHTRIEAAEMLKEAERCRRSSP